MKTFTHLHTARFGLTGLVLTLVFLLLQHADVQAQKYWRGGAGNKTETDWNTAANWRPVGVPGPTDDVVIGDDGTAVGDSGFDGAIAGSNNPDIPPGSVVSIKSLTVGVGKTGKLLVGASDFSVSGNVTIGASGVFENHGSSAYYSGNFEVAVGGVYKETGYSSNPGYAWGNPSSKIWPYTELMGTGKTIKFPISTMGFSYLKVSGSVKMLSAMTLITVNRVRKHKIQADVIIGSDNPKMYVSGTFDPMEYKVAFDASPTFVVEQSGTIYVKAVNYKDNYAYSSTGGGGAIFPTMDPLGAVNYGRSTAEFSSGDQNVHSSQQYGVLRISGTGVKTLEAPGGSPLIQTSIMSNIFVESGTLDVVDRSLNRASAGGTMYVANGAKFRLSGANNFPQNFTTYDLGSSSIAEYYGGNQAVKSVKYGHLYLTGPDADAAVMSVKTMDATAMVVSGDLKIYQDASFIANSTIQVDGSVSISNVASFDGSSFTHTVGGNWTNDANFTGSSSTVRLTGTGKVISRTAAVTSTLKNEFNNLVVLGLSTTISIPSTQTLVVKGDLSTAGAGTLGQSIGSLTMEGAAKTISGNGIVLNDFIANGSTTTTTSFTVKGDFTVNIGKSFIATGGTVTMAGDGSKNIVNSAASIGNLTFYGLRIDATTKTSSSFYIDSDLSGNNLTATTAGTVEFRGATATFAGVHNLFDVVVSGTDRRMVTNSNMGVASTLTVSGLLNVTANIPNTVTYNGTIAQTVAPITYHHLVFDKTGNKLANNNLQVNGDITIKSGSNFYAGENFIHTLEGDWINYGYFYAEKNSVDPASSSLILSGTRNTSFSGTPLNKTVYKSLTVDKTSASIVSLNYDITTTDLNLTNGSITTIVDGQDPFAANPVEVRVTGERSGSGWVQGTIKRSIAGGYKPAVVYSFNAPDVQLSFTTVTGLDTVAITTVEQTVTGFAAGVPINRLFKISTSANTYTEPVFRIHYADDDELNGNVEKLDEEGIKPFYSTSGKGDWVSAGKAAYDITLNWVETTKQTNGLGYYWTLSDESLLYKWQGDVDALWSKAGNWRVVDAAGVESDAITPPTISDIAEFGSITPADNLAGLNGATSTNFFEPVVDVDAKIKIMQYKHRTEIDLNFANTTSSLFVRGNLLPISNISDPSAVHAIITADKTLTVGNLIMDDTKQKINISKTSGEITVNSITQNQAQVELGIGTLKIKGNYNFGGTSEKFNSGVGGKVIYEGGNTQTVADVPYYHLEVNKTGGVAQYSTANNPEVRGNLLITTGTMLLQESNALTVNGNITIDGVLNANTANIDAKGNWTRSTAGKFIPGTGTVRFVGAGAQNLTGSPFNNLIVNNGPSGYATVTSENAAISGDLTIASGKLLLNDGLTMNRTAAGGALTLDAGATLELKGVNNFPANFNTNTVDSLSTVIYSGTSTQLINPLTYGKLTIEGSGSKLLTGTTNVLGDLKVTSASASLNGNGHTLTISKNFYNYGVMFYPSQDPTTLTGTLVLAKSDDTPRYIKGIILANNLIVQKGAHYTFTDSLNIVNNIDIDGDGDVFEDPNVHPKLRVLKESNIPNNGYLDVGDLTVSIGGNFKGAGFLLSKGIAIFTGTRAQTIQLLAPIIPIDNTPPTVVFAGSVSPILNSTRSPEFGSVIISNTGGVTASVGWTIFGLLEIKSSDLDKPAPKIGKFHGASYTHNIYTAVVNGGIMTSSGLINFNPIDQGKVDALKTKPYYPFQFGGSPQAFVSIGTLRIGGDQPIALLGALPESLNNLIIANTNAAGVSGGALAPALPLYGGGWNILGNMSIEAGAKFNGGATIVYDAESGASMDMRYYLSGNLTNNGTLAAGDASFIMKGANAVISGTGTSTFGNLTTTAGSNLTLNKNININVNLTHDGGTFTAPTATVSFIGTKASEVKTSNTALSLSNLRVAKDVTDPTSVPTVNLKKALDKVANINVESGTLDLETNTVTEIADDTETVYNTILSVANDATLKVGGTSTLPTVDSTALAVNSNVVYYGGDQEIKNVQYGNLRLENTLGLDKLKTFLPAEGTTKIAGSFVLDKTPERVVDRSKVIAPATIEYNGGDQQVAGIDYNNLSIATGGTKTLNDIVGVADAFTNTGAATVDAVTNATTVNYNGSIAQDVLPLNYYNLSLTNSGIKTFSTINGVKAAFTSESRSLANLTASETTIDFNGSGPQTIPALDYSKVLLSEGGDKLLAGDANIAKELRLTKGKITTGSNKFILSSVASIAEDENNYVTGFVETQRTMTTALESFGGLGIEITPALAPGLVTVVRETGRAVGPSNNSILRNYSFVVSDVNSKLDATVTFHYFTHELNGLTENTLQLFNSLDGVKWYAHENSTPNIDNDRLGATGVPTLRHMTLASRMSPLPVELIYFNAVRDGNDALLTWETATEEENQGFGVEVSKDGLNYKEIGFVSQGTGTTRAAIKYTFRDTEQGKNGMRYYRLRQQDFSGKTTYYGPRAIAFDVVKEVLVAAYPNPFQNNLMVNISAVAPGKAVVEVYNTVGQRLMSQSYQVEAGVTVLPLNMVSSVTQSGIYFVVVEIEGQRHRLKVVRE